MAATPATKAIRVTFTAPTDTGGFTITHYQYSAVISGADIWVNRDDFGAGVPNTTSPLTITKTSEGLALAANTTYTIKIRAVTSFTTSPNGATSSTLTVLMK